MSTYTLDRAYLLGEVRRVMPEHEETVRSIAAQERAEGWTQGRANALLQILEHRFGPLVEDVRELIAVASSTEVDGWLDRAIDASTLDAVFGTKH
jgi:hypothetical protein